MVLIAIPVLEILIFFMVKFNSSGAKQWTKQLGTFNSEMGNDITSDSSGNVYVIGGIGGGGLDCNPRAGGQDIFLVKYK